MDTVAGACHLCQGGYVANIPTVAVVRAWAHLSCMERQGWTQRELDAAVACCHALESLQNLCGTVLQHDPTIPGDQIVRVVPKVSMVRYRLNSDGSFTLLETTLPGPPPAEGSAEARS